MEWLDRMNGALDYIEDNLTGEVLLEEAAKQACCSSFNFQQMWKRIFTEWFPTSGYEILEGPQIEWYSDGDGNSEDYKSEIWIPVQKKS